MQLLCVELIFLPIEWLVRGMARLTGTFARALRPNTRAVYIESLANPKNDVLDYEAIARVVHQHGLPVVCDNTVLTPILFRPFDYGIDLTLHQVTVRTNPTTGRRRR